MANALVVYYSRKGENYMPGGLQFLEKGHTAYASEFIQQAIGADLFEIEAAEPYAAGYRECCARAVEEMKSHARPEVQSYLDDVSQYDTIFVCFPSWCGTAPMCVFTFLEHYDLTGKRIIPLCTNEGSGMGNAEKDLAESCGGATVLSGLSVKGHQVKDSHALITDWAKSHF